MSARVAALVVFFTFTRWRWLALAAVVTLAAFSGWHARQLGVEHANESLNVPDPERIANYQRFRTLFGSDEDLLVAIHASHLLHPATLAHLHALTQELERIDGVAEVLSLTNALRIVAGHTGAELAPLLPTPYDRPNIETEIRKAMEEMPELVGWLISADSRTAGIWVALSEQGSHPEQSHRLIEAVRNTLAAFERRTGLEAHLTGVPVQKHDVTAYIQRDERLLLPVAIAVLGSVLWIYFRSLLAALLPLLVAGLTVVAIHGGLVVAGLRLNAITSLLPPIVLVLAVTPCIHLLHFWYHGVAPTAPRERVRAMLEHLLWPCFLCAGTTASGFATLALNAMPAVRQFGVAAAAAALLGFVLAVWMVPFATTNIGRFFRPAQVPRVPRPLRALLLCTARTSTRAPRLTLVCGFAAALAMGSGMAWLRNNTDLVRFLKPGAPLREDTFWIDSHLTGPYPLEFLVERRDGRRLAHAEDLRRLAAWTTTVSHDPLVSGVLSIADLVRHLHRAEFRTAAPVLPTDDEVVEELLDLVAAAPDQRLVRRLLSSDQTAARIQVRLRAAGTADIAAVAERFLASARAQMGPDYTVHITGALYALAQDSNELVRQLAGSFAASFFLVGVLVAWGVGSLRVGAIALIPNLLPIGMTIGLLGWAGIDLSTGTAMIAAAAMGLVVDDTIHYVSAFQTAQARASLPTIAARRATIAVGPALIANNLVIVAGFWVGLAGSFLPTVYFSLFTGVSMILALLYDLWVTPACLISLGNHAHSAEIR